MNGIWRHARYLVLIVLLAGGLLWLKGTPQATPLRVLAWGETPPVVLDAAAPLLQSQPATHTPKIWAAGDIVTCAPDAPAHLTASLLDEQGGTVLVLGDSVYHKGTDIEYADCYDPIWGRHKERTKPAPGNHEYLTEGASGYYRYFGAAASPLDEGCTSHCKGYYSYDLGEWHIVALNSEIDMRTNSEQVQWLRRDLAANSTVCTLAYWHRPRFSSGMHGNDPSTHALWQTLYEYGADVILNAHDHNYERFAPQDPAGQLDAARGMRQFIVGTGGGALRDFGRIQPNSEVRYNKTWGLLKLNLFESSYDWEFKAVDGTSGDYGYSSCLNGGSSSKTPASPNPSPPPGRPAGFLPVIR